MKGVCKPMAGKSAAVPWEEKSLSAPGAKKRRRNAIKKNYVLYLFILPAFLYLLIFHYFPIYGLQIAFKNFVEVKGITGSDWVGLKHFRDMFASPMFLTLLKNTLLLSLYQLAAGFPFPIILALLLNYQRSEFYKKLVQNVSYMPYFISTVVMAGTVILLLAPNSGMLNRLLVKLGGASINFMGSERYFRSVYVLSGLWQTMGWSSVIYIATLSNVDPQIHESAMLDGASKLKRIFYIDLPFLAPTATILLILNIGTIMNMGFEKAYLLQNPMNLATSEIISTYVYKLGILHADYSFSAAFGLFNNVINCALLSMANLFAKKSGGNSLW